MWHIIEKYGYHIANKHHIAHITNGITIPQFLDTYTKTLPTTTSTSYVTVNMFQNKYAQKVGIYAKYLIAI